METNKQIDLDILKSLFWEYDWTSIKENLTSPFVIARVLELGNTEQFHLFVELVGNELIKAFLYEKGEKLLSPQSFIFGGCIIRKMKLLSQHKKAIEAVRPFIKQGEFYLAGGPAVYYYLSHRESIDLDFFTKKDFDFLQYQHLFYPYSILFSSRNTIHAEVERVKASFFHHPYSLLRPTNQLDIIAIAHLEDILCMKINAIISRGSRKDFTDVYFIMQELSLSPEKCIELFQTKYGAYNPLVIHKSMTYFADADSELELKMLKAC